MLKLRPVRPRKPMPPAPPLTLSLALATTLVLGGWFVATAVHGMRMDGGFLMVPRDRLAERALPAWDEMASAFRRGNPPPRLPVPAGDPRPTLAAMLDKPYVRAAFHLAPDATLTYQARGQAPAEVDLRAWRPTTFNLAPWLGPQAAGFEARRDAETTILALVRDDALARHAGPVTFDALPVEGGRRLVALGTRKRGWLGYETAVCGTEGAEILARHGLAEMLAWSSDVDDGPGDRFYIPHQAITPRGSGVLLPPEIRDLRLLPFGAFIGHNTAYLIELLQHLSLLLIACGVSLIVSLRQLRHLMRHRALAEARGRFVSGMSHEMRTPLTTIKLYAEMLQHEVVVDPDARRGYLGTIARECDRLTRLVENVLAYAALESKARPLVIDEIDAREAIDDAVAATRGLLDQAGLRVEVHAPIPLRIAADRDALVLAIANLLTNAAKYAADGRVVMLSALPAPDDPHAAVIAVRDFGPGIPDHERAKIFEPFYRRRHERGPGTGLGLALVQETVQGHGGRVDVAGEPGEGTEFRLRIPLAPPEAEA